MVTRDHSCCVRAPGPPRAHVSGLKAPRHSEPSWRWSCRVGSTPRPSRVTPRCAESPGSAGRSWWVGGWGSQCGWQVAAGHRRVTVGVRGALGLDVAGPAQE